MRSHVPYFMAPDLPMGFVQRPREFNELRRYLLDPERGNPVAITTALRGSGGFGKTTLAAALCHDDDIVTAFDDGILWTTLGQQPNIQGELTKLYAALTGERPGFVDVEDAAVSLAQRLEHRNCLILIDDVWDEAHLRPFLRGGKGCGRLITTRQFEIAAAAERVGVDEMTPSEAVEMLTVPLPHRPHNLAPFQALAKRLGEWPLLLRLAGSALRQRIERGDTLERALDYVNRALNKRGVTVFDKENPAQRNQAVAASLGASLDLLTDAQRQRYAELAIFPEDADIPLTALAALWGLDEFDTEDLAQRLADLSLLDLDLGLSTVSLHDIVRAFLAGRLQDPTALHVRLLDAWGDAHKLPDAYAWRWVAYHLVEAERKEQLRELLLDFHWLQAKLGTTDVSALIADFDHMPDDPVLRLVQGALRLSAHVLAKDPAQLASQLHGRLLGQDVPEIQTLLRQARGWRGTSWLRPLTPSLIPPGGPLMCTLAGHSILVTAVAVTADGRRAVSASGDRTLKLWDLEKGKALANFSGEGGRWRSPLLRTG